MINYSSKWWYKLITIILVLALILYFSIGFAPKASAVVVSTVIVGSILAAMAATGIGLAVSGMTAQELTQWVSDKLNDWTTDIGGSIQDHIDNSLISVTTGGVLAIGSAAAQGIADFISWLINQDNIVDNSTINIYESYSLVNGYSVMKLPTPYYYAIDEYGNDIRQLILPGNGVSDNVYCYVKPDGTMTVFSSETSTIRMQNGTNPIFTGYLIDSYNDWYFYSGFYKVTQGSMSLFTDVTHNVNFRTLVGSSTNVDNGGEIDYVTETIIIPTIDENEKWFLDVGADAGEDVDTVTDGVITDTLTNTLEVSDEIVESNAQEVVIVNEDAIAVNVDHHMIGFSNLPDFAHLNLNSIWHYVSDAVDYASSWLAWFVSFLTAMPLLAIPLYMSFTLLVVLSFLRRFI